MTPDDELIQELSLLLGEALDRIEDLFALLGESLNRLEDIYTSADRWDYDRFLFRARLALTP